MAWVSSPATSAGVGVRNAASWASNVQGPAAVASHGEVGEQVLALCVAWRAAPHLAAVDSEERSASRTGTTPRALTTSTHTASSSSEGQAIMAAPAPLAAGAGYSLYPSWPRHVCPG